jgi:EmrB/QacA subfamily drug resistance transporter
MPPPAPLARRYWALGVLSLIQLMVALDSTVISIALPWAQRELGFTNADRQWLITAYALAFGSLLLLGGRLSDLWGRRAALVVGLTGFAAASVLGGVAHSFAQLVAARCAQGAFGALLAPAALAALSTTFTDPGERARAFTLYGAVGGSGAAIGLLLGGALTQWATWRWCLFVNLIFSGVALCGIGIFVKDGGRTRPRLDVLGTVVGSIGLFGVVYAFSRALTAGWGDETTWGPQVAGTLLLIAFARWQLRARYPLIPPRVLTNRTRGGSLLALFLTNAGVFGASLFLAYYLQSTLGYTPLRTGVYFLPLVVALILSATLATARLLDMVGPRPLVPVGMVLGALGMALFTKLAPQDDYLSQVLPGLVVLGLGLGLIYAPAIASVTAGVRREEVGAASAMVTAAQQVGGSVGTALLNTIAVSVTTRFLRTPHGANAWTALTRATLHGYAVAFWWAAGFFGVGAVACFILLESGVPEAGSDRVAASA